MGCQKAVIQSAIEVKEIVLAKPYRSKSSTDHLFAVREFAVLGNWVPDSFVCGAKKRHHSISNRLLVLQCDAFKVPLFLAQALVTGKTA